MMLNSTSWLNNWLQDPALVAITLFVLLQWFLLQALFIHYYFFRKKMMKIQQEHLRMNLLEKIQNFHSEQLEQLCSKFSELHRDVSKIVFKDFQARSSSSKERESSFPSSGERSLRNRLREWKGN